MAKLTLTLPELHDAQKLMLSQARRYNVACLGRRSGKSFCGVDILLTGQKGALAGYPVAWYAPTYALLTEIWKKLVHLLKPITKPNGKSEQQKRIELVTGGVIECWSLDDPDAGRGRRYAKVVIDEAAMIRRLEEAWEQSIQPLLMDFRGEAWFLSTPKGGNYFKTLFDKGNPANPDRRADWMSWQMPTSCNPYIDPEEIERMRSEMPALVFAQEVLAEFVNFGGAVIKREWLRTGQPPAGLELHMGVDLAISLKEGADYTAIAVVGVEPITGHVWVLDVEHRRCGFREALQFVKDKAARFRPQSIAVEAVQYQAAAVEELLRSTDLPVFQVKPDRDKLTRFQRLQPRYEQGLVWHSDRLPGYFTDELLSFPEGDHDDMVDALVYAYGQTGDYGRSRIYIPDVTVSVHRTNLQQSIERVVPKVASGMFDAPMTDTCGGCIYFDQPARRCRNLDLITGAESPACDHHVSR